MACETTGFLLIILQYAAYTDVHVSIEHLESNKQQCKCVDVLMFHNITVCSCVVVFMLLSRK